MTAIRRNRSARGRPSGHMRADKCALWQRIRHGRDEVGAALAVWLLVAAVPIGFLLTGYIYDGGNVREAQQMAYRTAEKAARLAPTLAR